MILIQKLLNFSGLALFFFLVIFRPVYAETTASPLYSPGALIAQMLLGLGLVLGLIFSLMWITKRLGYGKLFANNKIQVLSSAVLGSREKAVLVKVGESVMLLGVSPGRVNQLHLFDKQESLTLSPESTSVIEKSITPSNSKSSSDFSHFLKNIMNSEAEK